MKSADLPTDEEKQIQGENSRPLDVHRWSDYPQLRNCLSELIVELECAEKRSKARHKKTAKRFREAVRCLVLDLYVAWSTDPELLIGVSRGSQHFLKKTRYANLFLTYGQFKAAFDGLRDQGYLEITMEGFNDRRSGVSRSTRVRATPKLIQLLQREAKLSTAAITTRLGKDGRETIILKDKKKVQIDYKDTALTRQMRNDLWRINDGLDRNRVDLELSDKDFKALQGRMAGDRPKGEMPRGAIDLTSKHLFRVFNNGVWTDGGRFYGGWWQIVPSEFRKHITINDKETREVDYSRFHPHMLYAEVGVEMRDDAYQIPGLRASESLVKRTFNKLINAEGRMAIDAEFEAAQLGITWDEFLARIIKHHAPISKFMGTGYGVKLQRKDADIANAIMLRFLDMNYTCLPVHDSFIVHHALRDELEQIMVEEYERVFGSKIGYKVKPTDDYVPIDNGPIDHDRALKEAFGLEGDFQGYNQRRLNWETYKSLSVDG